VKLFWRAKMEIKTGKEIVEWTRGKSISEMSVKPYNKKWVAVDDMILLLNKQRNISDIAYTHRNEVIDKLINALQNNSKGASHSLNKDLTENQKLEMIKNKSIKFLEAKE
jgi:hypothetical protein